MHSRSGGGDEPAGAAQDTGAPAIPTSGRRWWLQVDLVCLQCGRALGALICQQPRQAPTRVPALHRFQLFRSADATRAVERVVSLAQLRCGACGGQAVVEEVQTFTTVSGGGDDEDKASGPRPRGRPPKPMRSLPDSRLVELGLAV